ncbi:MAG: hypothetical protein ACXADD_19390 [Candidatus Thorarchaeota archaeon]
MAIQLSYVDGKGVEHTEEYNTEVTEIDLDGKGIICIDLSPLSDKEST